MELGLAEEKKGVGHLVAETDSVAWEETEEWAQTGVPC